MLGLVVKFLFLITAFVFASMVVYGKLFVFKKKHPAFVSDYCATIAGVVGGYSVLSLILVWILPSNISKLIMFGFALSPFLLGLLANYHTEKYYTVIQVLLIILSIGYIIF